MYNRLGSGSKVVIGGLVHAHPLKGTNEFIGICRALNDKYGNNILVTGVGEQFLGEKPDWFLYHSRLSRQGMADYMKAIDIWVGCSHTEGLGRMALEAMSAGVACALSDTGAEYVKHRKNALTFPVGNAQKGAERVQQLLEDANTFTGILACGYDTAETAADPTEYMDKIEQVIKELRT
jgi:glycosyltransferase involved in cell wall biosynthesis